MRIAVKLIILTLIFFGCNQHPKQKFKEVDKNNKTVKTEKIITDPNINVGNKVIKIEQLNQLIPIDTVNSKSKNVYEKYGSEFNGNCYACDLAELSIIEKRIKLTNVCDENVNQVFEIVEIINTNNQIEMKTKQYDFILTEIDKAPIYELKIIGNYIKSKNLRISKYYTLKIILNRFEQHDCGDFGG